MTRNASLIHSAAMPGDMPSEPDLGQLPVRAEGKTAAALVSRYFFPVSPRTLERWPLRVRRVNGKALIETAELFAVARAKLDAAPLVMRGSAPAERAA